MYKTKIAITVGAVFFCSAASYAADTTSQAKPLEQAVASIDKNLAKDTDNKGLPNAKEHLQANQKRQETRDAKHIEKDESSETTEKAEHTAKTEHAEKAEHVDKAEKTEKAEHIEKAEHVEKAEKPEKAEHLVKVERPEKTGHPSH